MRISEWDGVVMGAWRARWKGYEEDVERSKREAKDHEEGHEVAGVSDWERKDRKEGSSVSMPLRMDIDSVSGSENVSEGAAPTPVTGPCALSMLSCAMSKPRAFLRASMQPLVDNPHPRAHEVFESLKGRFHFSPRTYFIRGFVDHRSTTQLACHVAPPCHLRKWRWATSKPLLWGEHHERVMCACGR